MNTLKTMTYEVTDRIARITLNRPERGNAITFDMPVELSACVEQADLDPFMASAIYTGLSSFFSIISIFRKKCF